MRLDQSTWIEVEAYLEGASGIFLPAGSTEQHGPIGLIGTDAICAENIAMSAADLSGAIVAPTLAYAPAPFNTAFPGTISVSADVYRAMVAEILMDLNRQGFRHVYILNGHGANIEPLREAAKNIDTQSVRVKSWWDFEAVGALRRELYGDWEGMHATPSETAITQSVARTINSSMADEPPRQLSADFIKAHAGDRHGSPAEHRAAFPDGRVGSHSALANPRDGERILKVAAESVARDFLDFCC